MANFHQNLSDTNEFSLLYCSIKGTHKQIQYYHTSLETQVLREDSAENHKSPVLELF